MDVEGTEVSVFKMHLDLQRNVKIEINNMKKIFDLNFV